MILELKDKLKGTDWGGELPAAAESARGSLGSLPDASQEAISALLVLGYSVSEASQAVQAIHTPGQPERPVEELVRLALRQLVRGQTRQDRL